MKMTRWNHIALGASLFALAPAPSLAEVKLPTLDRALRCAALTEAYASKPGLAGTEARSAYDHAIYWGMAASEVARAEGRTSAWFGTEQRRRASEAETALSNPLSSARAELQGCRSNVPPLGSISR